MKEHIREFLWKNGPSYSSRMSWGTDWNGGEIGMVCHEMDDIEGRMPADMPEYRKRNAGKEWYLKKDNRKIDKRRNE